MAIEVRTILVPLDFSHHADNVLDWASHMATQHQSRLVLLHATHLPVDFQQLDGAYLPPDFWTRVKEEAMVNLEGYAVALRERGHNVEIAVREGYPAAVIEAEAEERPADLIVIGTRGHGGLRHLLLGSVAERVVQKAPCPVLTVKTPP